MIECYAVIVDDKIDGIICTPDAKARAEAKVAELKAQGKDASFELYRGKRRQKL